MAPFEAEAVRFAGPTDRRERRPSNLQSLSATRRQDIKKPVVSNIHSQDAPAVMSAADPDGWRRDKDRLLAVGVSFFAQVVFNGSRRREPGFGHKKGGTTGEFDCRRNAPELHGMLA
jgi:hypothetical protein